MLLVFDEKRIDELIKDFVTHRILYLDSCQGHVVRPTPFHKALGLVNYEIIIQPNSTVETKGFHVTKSTGQLASIPMVPFVELAKVKGEIKVKAYIKTIITVAHNRSGPMLFGTGSITDGIHKLPIQVNSFKAESLTDLSKGCCVIVTGSTSNQGLLKLVCKDISAIQILKEEENLSIEKVQQANKPLKRYQDQENIHDSANKRIAGFTGAFKTNNDNKKNN